MSASRFAFTPVREVTVLERLMFAHAAAMEAYVESLGVGKVGKAALSWSVLAYGLVHATRALRRALPGVRCEAGRLLCCARGEWEVAMYDGDTGGGWAYCLLHAVHARRERIRADLYGELIPHACDRVCLHDDDHMQDPRGKVTAR